MERREDEDVLETLEVGLKVAEGCGGLVFNMFYDFVLLLQCPIMNLKIHLISSKHS